MITTSKDDSKKKNNTSTVHTYSVRILSVYGLLLTTVAAVPSYNIFIAVIYCNKDSTISQHFSCYEGFYLLHLTVALVGSFILAVFSIVFTLTYIDLNPCSSIPFAAPQSKLNLFRLLIKISLPVYTTIFFDSKMSTQYILILMVCFLMVLYFRINDTPFYNKSVFKWILICESVCLWVTICSVIHAFLDDGEPDNIGIIYLIFGTPFLIYTTIKLYQNKRINVMKTIVKDLQKPEDAEMYVNILIDLIENKHETLNNIMLQGVLKFHVQNCIKTKKECVCNELYTDKCNFLVQNYQDLLAKHEEDDSTNLSQWYLFIKSIMDECLEKFGRDARLHMLYAYIQQEKIKNKYKALFHLMRAENHKPNIQEEFSIYMYQNLIEDEMMEEDDRNNEGKNFDVSNIVVFQNKFYKYLEVIHKAVLYHKQFWRELQDQSPEIQKLQNLGSQITNYVDEVKSQFTKLQSMNASNVKCLKIHGNFLKNIVNDEQEGQRILQRVDFVSRSANMMQKRLGFNQEWMRYGENSNSCIIICSGNFDQMGEVIQVNQEITRILEYQKSDIVGQNINLIMPKVYAEKHNQFMATYFETSNSRVLNLQRSVYPINKQGYVVACQLYIKILPNLEKGIQIVGFLNEESQDSQKGDFKSEQIYHYILFNSGTGVVLGISKSCYTSFGIPAAFVYGNASNNNELTLDQLCGELLEKTSSEYLANNQKQTYVLDTTILQNHYFLVDEDSEIEDEIENSPNKEKSVDDDEIDQFNYSVDKKIRYRQAQIRCLLMNQEDYNFQGNDDMSVNICRFIEVDDNENDKLAEEEKQKEDEVKEEQGQIEGSEKNENEGRDSMQDLDSGSESNSQMSNISVENEVRKLKDFKNLIAEKSVPQSIKILSNTIIFLLFLLLALTVLEMYFKFQKNDAFQDGINIIWKCIERHDIMGDINYRVRMLELRGLNNFYPVNESYYQFELRTKNELLRLLRYMNDLQFVIVRDRISMEKKINKNGEIETLKYNIQYLLQNGETRIYRNIIFNDAVFQYITAATAIYNSTLIEVSEDDQEIDAIQKNYFFVLTNGIRELLTGSVYECDRFYDFHYGRTYFYQRNFLLMMVCGIMFTVISQMVLIPIVFSVYKTNNRVLALFGFITQKQILTLWQACEDFISKFIPDDSKSEYKIQEKVKPEKEEESEHEEEGQLQGEENNQEVQKNANQLVDDKTTKEKEPQNQVAIQNNQFSISKQPPSSLKNLSEKSIPDSSDRVKLGKENQKSSQNSETALKDSQVMMQDVGPSNQSQLIDQSTLNISLQDKALLDKSVVEKSTDQKAEEAKKEQEKKEKDNTNAIQERSEKLQKSKGENRQGIIFRFCFICVVIVCYFIFDFYKESKGLNQIRLNYKRLKMICNRPFLLKFVIIFTYEEIINGEPTIITGQNFIGEFDGRKSYIEQVYENEKSIDQIRNEKQSEQLLEYDNKFVLLNLGHDFCTNFYGQDKMYRPKQEKECQTVANGLANNGLKLSITAVLNKCHDIIDKFYQTQQQEEDVENAINNDDLTHSVNLMNYINEALKYLLHVFIRNFQAELTSQIEFEKMKLFIFFMCIIVIFLFLWIPYLNTLMQKIWRTKGMLNMIPMSIISDNQDLYQQFTRKELEKAII